LVAKGFMQSYGVNFTETWAPTAAARSVRLVISIAAMRQDRIRHIDIKSAYLNAKLSETVHVQPPAGYAKQGEVWLLLKALYGLKQAGREWYKMLKAMLNRLGWAATVSDPCVYYRRVNNAAVAHSYQLMVVHVDDLIVTYSDQSQIDSLIEGLSQEVKLADLGDLKHALGLDFITKDNKIVISQRTYVLDVLKRFGFDKCHPCPTPVHENREEYEGSVLDKHTGLSKHPLNEIVGSLLWLSVMTRPDISFSVATLAQFVSKPEPKVYSMASRIYVIWLERKTWALDSLLETSKICMAMQTQTGQLTKRQGRANLDLHFSRTDQWTGHQRSSPRFPYHQLKQR
jgi:hypothetical protein